MKIRRKCKCGCGEITNPGKRWILGHQYKGSKHSKEIRKKLSFALKGRKLSEEHKKNISLAAQNRSEEYKLKMSLTQLKLKHDPNYPYCEVWHDKEYKDDIRKDYCESINCKNNYRLLVNHHIYLDKKKCAPNDIMTLCASCHVSLHNKFTNRKSDDPKDFIMINRLDHVSYIHKRSRKIVRIEKGTGAKKGGAKGPCKP